MTLPRDYDAWRLAGPHDNDKPCPRCDDIGEYWCPECDGTGQIGAFPDICSCGECSAGMIDCDCAAYAREMADAADDMGDYLRDLRDGR